MEEVLAMSEHVERVLWQMGIFLVDVEGGRLWVDVCDDGATKHCQQASLYQLMFVEPEGGA